MPTRFYFPATGYTYPPSLDVHTQPAYSGSWTIDPQPPPGRSTLVFAVPNGTDGNYNQQRSDPGATNNPYYEDLQLFVSEPIPAFSFTTAQTFAGQFLCLEQTTTTGDVCGGVVIRLMSNDTATLRGTLLTWLPTVLGTPPDATTGTAWTGAATNRMVPPTLFVAGNTTGFNGDRLVIEIGYAIIDAGGGPPFNSAQGRIEFRATGTQDLPAGDQTSTDTTLNGWIEFSGDIFGGLGRTCRTRTTT